MRPHQKDLPTGARGWKRACWAALSFLPDARKPMGGTPYPRFHSKGTKLGPYTQRRGHYLGACVRRSSRQKAKFPRIPQVVHRGNGKEASAAGMECRIVRNSIVLRLLAPPNPPPRMKWLFARARALGEID